MPPLRLRDAVKASGSLTQAFERWIKFHLNPGRTTFPQGGIGAYQAKNESILLLGSDGSQERPYTIMRNIPD